MKEIMRVQMTLEFYKIVSCTSRRNPLFYLFQQISYSDTKFYFAKRYSLNIIKTDSHLVNYIP